MLNKKTILNLTAVSLAVCLFSSCNKHFTVQNSKYQQYGIDQKEQMDSSLVRYYLPYKKQMEAEMGRVIGKSDHELTKTKTPETLVGDFYADAILSEGLKMDPSIQFTMPTTKGGIRNPIAKGNITVENIFELMPFENELVKLKLSGAGVQKLIDFVIASEGQPVAGLRMKVVNKVATEVTIGGKPFDINQTYIVLTSDYLANSGDDQRVFANPLERVNIGKKVREALMNYVEDQTKNGKTINTQLDGRVVIE
jgi:2',3'-cyclic-nucleotide 2'-phosphodiesterase (5'-nucleotidase family)